MDTFVRLYSDKSGEILRFLKHFYQNTTKHFDNDLLWENSYKNPIEMADIISALVENQEDYKINVWICLDKDLLINVTKNNVDEIIRYLYERYPY